MFSVFVCEISSLQSSNRCARLHESHRTLRDGSLGWRCPRHFVPGYDRTVPPGHFPPTTKHACPIAESSTRLPFITEIEMNNVAFENRMTDPRTKPECR